MIMRKLLALSKRINEHRHDMYELAKEKGISDPQVLKISQQLDGEVFMLQKFIYELHPLSKAKSLQ